MLLPQTPFKDMVTVVPLSYQQLSPEIVGDVMLLRATVAPESKVTWYCVTVLKVTV